MNLPGFHLVSRSQTHVKIWLRVWLRETSFHPDLVVYALTASLCLRVQQLVQQLRGDEFMTYLRNYVNYETFLYVITHPARSSARLRSGQLIQVLYNLRVIGACQSNYSIILACAGWGLVGLVHSGQVSNPDSPST